MAKMRVSELAKELGVPSKDLVAFLKDRGIEKAAQSNIEDEQIELVKKNFGSGVAQAKEAAPKKEAKAKKEDKKTEETPAKAQAEAPAKRETAEASPKKPADSAKAEAKGSEGMTGAEGEAKKLPPKKKKPSIIFVSNPNNSKMPAGSRPPMSAAPSGPRRPMPGAQKPVQLGPNQIINKATGKIIEKLPPRTKEPEETAPEIEVKSAETVNGERNAQSRDNREHESRGRSSEDPRRDDKKGSRHVPSDNRGGGSFDRSQRGNARPGDRQESARPGQKPGRGFQAPDIPSSKPGASDKRRDNQAKDKRSKKDALYEDGEIKNKNKAGRFIKPEKKEEPVEDIKVITLPEVLTIRELADKMKMQPSAIVKKLFLKGQVVTVNQEISYEDAENIAIEFDIMCEQEVKVDVIEELLKEEEEATETMVERAPVICVMGHVDHGKTSLLDAIRKTNVTDKEAGGITQHIGAYTVKVGDRKITFLDTPGHEAFTAMRMRGANATDIAILVVAADDGVMPQTVEAINHAKAAGIEIIVAVNKIDKPNANIDKVKQELAEYELIPEDWGGSTVFAPVSAKSGEGIKELLDMVLLTADILELKANPKRKARGLVIEAELDKGRGPVATVLVQKGTLKVGDFISAGVSHGKVRAMIDDKGRRVKEAGPSIPVEILGLNDVPGAGEVFIAHESDKQAKQFADTFIAQSKVKKLEETKSKMSLDDVFAQIQEGNLKELNLIVKADVQGSVEAVKQSLVKLSNEEVVVKCIHGGVGAINESDVSLAAASNAIIIGFNVRIDAVAKETADREGVDVRLYKVIYQAIDDVEAAMKGMLDPVYEEKVIGHAEVRQIFKASAVGNIAGSYVLDGVFTRGCKIRISREGEQIYEGALASLKRFKDDVKEVKAGFECGLVFEDFDSMQELDQVEAYEMVEVPR